MRKLISTKKVKIGIDIDNVLTDSYRFVLERFNQNFATQVRYEEVFDFYYLEKYAGVDISRAKFFIKEIIHSDEFHQKLSPFREAVETIKSWSKHGFLIYYITARHTTSRDLTAAWLKKHGFMVGQAFLEMMDYEKYDDPSIFKRDVVERECIDIVVEDSREVARALKIPVYMFDRPWNKGELPKNITRINSWHEIKLPPLG